MVILILKKYLPNNYLIKYFEEPNKSYRYYIVIIDMTFAMIYYYMIINIE